MKIETRGSGTHDETTAATLAAGLCLARLVPSSQIARRAGPWILATSHERLELPPVGVIADLGELLVGAGTRTSFDPLRTTGTLPEGDVGLAASLRRYEDAVLGRLAASGRLATAGYAVARLPREMHAQAVGILVAGVLSRIGFDGGLEVEPGVVRRLIERKPAEAVQRGYAALRDDEGVRKRLTEDYAALARGAQRTRDLIGDADLFALENLTVLGTLTQRLAIADVLRAQEAIASALPRRFPRRREREGDVASKLEDESAYPVGGFSSVTTSGSLENLVTSELIYMDPPPKGGGEGPKAYVDLFDMRYVEGELMYYARDEAILVRRRRIVVLALGSDLVRARVKDRALPWQRIVLVLGAVLVVMKKLAELLGEEELEVRVVFLHEEGGTTPLAPEMALAGLMLREWRDRRMADVLESTWGEVVEFVGENAKRALLEVVRINALPGAPIELGARVVQADLQATHESLEGWSRATAELLSALI